MHCAKFGLNWPSGSGEKVENDKSLQWHPWQTTDKIKELPYEKYLHISTAPTSLLWGGLKVMKSDFQIINVHFIHTSTEIGRAGQFWWPLQEIVNKIIILTIQFQLQCLFKIR